MKIVVLDSFAADQGKDVWGRLDALGTVSVHARTARAYTDYGMFTCSEAVGQDLHELFLQMTSLTQVPKLKALLQSPFTLHGALIEKIDNGTFGVCDDCGDKISVKRLEARPETTLCIRCKEDQ